jgi:hypothetical protein
LHCQSKLQRPFGDPISASVIWRPLPRYVHSVKQLPFWRHGLLDDKILNGTLSLHSLWWEILYPTDDAYTARVLNLYKWDQHIHLLWNQGQVLSPRDCWQSRKRYWVNTGY